MKRTIQVLAIRRETLRTLRALDDRELGRAAGAGQDEKPTKTNCVVRAGVGPDTVTG